MRIKFGYKDSWLRGRFCYTHETTELPLHAKGAWCLMGTPKSAAGTRKGPFVDCYMAVSQPPLLRVSLALSWAAMTRQN